MTRKSLYPGLALLLLATAVVPALAAPKNSKGMKINALVKGKFNIVSSLSLNGTTLKPGSYDVVATDSQVSFFLNGKQVAQAPIQWQGVDAQEHNAIVDNSGKLQEIRFKGKNRSIVIQ